MASSELNLHQDQNGQYVVSKSFVALASLLIVILTTTVAVVTYSVGVKSDVNHLQTKDLAQDQAIQKLQEAIQKTQVSTARIEEKLVSIESLTRQSNKDLKALIQNNP